MSEDEIEPLCKKLFLGIIEEKEEQVQSAALQLLCGFLTDINRLAWFTQQLAERQNG